MLCLRLACFLVLVGSSIAHAYDLSVSKFTEGLLKKERVHEALTLATLKCAELPDAGALGCLAEPSMRTVVAPADVLTEVNRFPADDAGVSALVLEGVRWPDDPDRNGVLANLPAHKGMCVGLAESYGDFAKKTCLSHYGRLQSFHAMEPVTTKTSPERVGIDVLLEFLLPIAAGEVPPGTIVDAKAELPAARLAASLFPLAAQNRFDFNWIFGTNCKLQKVPSQCVTERLTQLQLQSFALGAVLHIIQDSFARAHAFRPDTDTKGAVISCAPIFAFFSYPTQNADKHGAADRFPTFDANCLDEKRTVDDPISAGAQVIKRLRAGDDPATIKKYLLDHVFATTQPELVRAYEARKKLFAK